MTKKSLKTAVFALSVATVALAAPAPAGAEEEALVPTDNGAVNQYTEAIPTSGGGKDVHRGKDRSPSPAKVLGGKKAHELERHGADGHAVAALTAETAPPSATTNTAGGATNGSGGAEAPPGSAGDETGTAGKKVPHSRTEPPATDGSSAVGEVAAHATGSSSGELGWLLPLAIVAATSWAALFALRHRRRRAA